MSVNGRPWVRYLLEMPVRPQTAAWQGPEERSGPHVDEGPFLHILEEGRVFIDGDL